METIDRADVERRLRDIDARISAVAGRHVDIVAVTKNKPAEVLETAVAAGVRILGENYAQEVRAKANVIDQLRATGVEVHFIGQLQTNKVRMVVPHVDMVQSVDRQSLVDELARRAPGMRVLIQIDTSGGQGRGGCALDEVQSLVDSARSAGLAVEGLMTVGPAGGDHAALRAAFTRVSSLVSDLDLRVCSMGMSDDHLIAVEEGSTMVRIGTALLGGR